MGDITTFEITRDGYSIWVVEGKVMDISLDHPVSPAKLKLGLEEARKEINRTAKELDGFK